MGDCQPGPTASRRDFGDRSARTAVLVDQLHAIVQLLEDMHPGRKFPLDGHLVGSIGEAAAEEWLAWVGEHRRRVDPLGQPLRPPADPEFTPHRLAPFMRGLSPFGPT